MKTRDELIELYDQKPEAFEVVIDEMLDTLDDGSYLIAEDIRSVMAECGNDREVLIADRMFSAILGWSLSSLIGRAQAHMDG